MTPPECEIGYDLGRRIRAIPSTRPHYERVIVTTAEQPTLPEQTALPSDAQQQRRQRVTAPIPHIVRPGGLARANRPADVPAPEHKHLPGWAKRVHAQARPILADILGQLEGEPRDLLAKRVDDVVAAISQGKFSAAWQYPQLITDGDSQLTEQRAATAVVQRERRDLENQRRRVSDALRGAAPNLAADAQARLGRALRSAGDAAAIGAVDLELRAANTQARTSDSKRRDREVERTRQRISRAGARGAVGGEPQETWQDVLKRLTEEPPDGT